MSSAHGANALSLAARLADLLGREREAMADFLLALADFDRRRLWLDLGYPGLFVFLHRELGLSKGAAHFRKVAADLVQRFPEVVGPLRDGRLCITSVVELAKVATRENIADILPRFFHRSRTEAREVAVEIRPAAVIPRREVTTSLPAALPRTTPAPQVMQGAVRIRQSDGQRGPARVLPVEPNAPTRDARAPPPEPAPLQARVLALRDAVEPLTADLRRLHVTVSRRFLEKLERARAALSHSRPGAATEEILEAGLDLILEAQARRNGAAERPSAKPRPSRPDHVPASVRRQVWKRDTGRCQWPIAGRAGGICGSTLRVEIDHVLPRARGGPSTVDNLRLLCDVHNQHAARLAFGDAFMNRRVRAAGRGPRSQSGSGTRNAQGAPSG